MKFITIGKILGTHGIKGFIRVKTPNDYAFFANLEYLVVGENGKILHSYKIEEVKTNKNIILIKCQGIETIEDAIKLKGLYLFSTTDETSENKDECTPEELFGAKVTDFSGNEFGIVEDILDNGFNEIFRIRALDGKFFLIANNEQHVLKIDIVRKVIQINPEGLVSEDI